MGWKIKPWCCSGSRRKTQHFNYTWNLLSSKKVEICMRNSKIEISRYLELSKPEFQQYFSIAVSTWENQFWDSVESYQSIISGKLKHNCLRNKSKELKDLCH